MFGLEDFLGRALGSPGAGSEAAEVTAKPARVGGAPTRNSGRQAPPPSAAFLRAGSERGAPRGREGRRAPWPRGGETRAGGLGRAGASWSDPSRGARPGRFHCSLGPRRAGQRHWKAAREARARRVRLFIERAARVTERPVGRGAESAGRAARVGDNGLLCVLQLPPPPPPPLGARGGGPGRAARRPPGTIVGLASAPRRLPASFLHC